MGFLTLLSGVAIGITGKWLYDNDWKLPTRDAKSKVMVVDTPTVHTTVPSTPTMETGIPSETQTY